MGLGTDGRQRSGKLNSNQTNKQTKEAHKRFGLHLMKLNHRPATL